MNNLTHILTPQEVLNGFLLVDAEGAEEDLVLPSAALLVAAMPGVTTNTTIRLIVRNTGGETIDMVASTGITLSPVEGVNNVIATAKTGEYLIVLTNVTPGNEAGVCYTLSTDSTQ